MMIDRVEHNKYTASSDDQNTSSTHTVEQDLNIEKVKEKVLIESLLKKEATLKKINREKKQLQKEKNHIKKSRTWQLTSPVRKISGFFRTFFQGSKSAKMVEENQQLAEQNRLLEIEIQRVNNELKIKQEHIGCLEMETNKLNEKYIHQTTKKIKEDSDIIQYIHNLIQRKEIVNNNYNEALRRIGRHYNREKTDFKQIIYSNILPGLKIEEIPEFIVRFAEAEQTLSLQNASSFRASLTTRARLRQLMEGSPPENLLDNKIDAYKLMDDLGIKRPWIKEYRYKYANIPKEEGIVIKPVDGAGSRGVYLVYNVNRIQDVKQSKILTDWEALEARMREDLESGWVASDEWMIEELIVKNKQEHVPATDLKFYCFYGKVALILEITRFPELSYCWWTAGGDRIGTGKYDENLFKGEGVTSEEIETVANLSFQLPTPFIRIDFLRAKQGMVFGEFTPKPGNYDEFDEQTDKWLGEYYLDAEGRLLDEFINGKSFDVYNRWLSQMKDKENPQIREK